VSEFKAFNEWKSKLVRSAGGIFLASAVLKIGDHVLELFYREGMEPTIAALMEYAQAGLSKRHEIRAIERDSQSRPADTARR